MAEDFTPEMEQELLALESQLSGGNDFTPEMEQELIQLENSIHAQKEPTGMLEQAANLGLSYQQGRTLGIMPKVMSAIGAGMAKPVLEGYEKINPEFTAPSYGDLYKTGVRGVQGKVNQSYEDNPILTGGAELVGGVRTGLQAGGSKIGQAINNWTKGTQHINRPLASRAASLFSKTGKQALTGGVGYAAYKQGIADPDKQGEGVGKDILTGGAISGGLGLTGSGLSYGINKLTPAVDDALTPIVEMAKKYNIPTSLDQVTDSKALKNIQKVSQELPFSGHDKFRAGQMSSFNRALSKTFGEDSDRFTPELMQKAFKRLGGEFDNFAKGKKYSADSLKNNVDDFLSDADELYSKEAFDAAKKRILIIAKDFDDNGMLNGEKLSFHRQKVNELARKANDFDKQSIYRDLENALIETATEGDEALKAGFTKTKHQYKNLIAIEPLATKARGGNLNPTLLNNRVAKVYGRAHTTGQSGDIGEIARVGHELLGELGGSDTTQKMLYTGGAGGAAAAGQYVPVAGALAANKGFQKWFNQNPQIVENALMKAYQKQIGGDATKKLTAQTVLEEGIK